MKNIILGLLLIISLILIFVKIQFEYYHILLPAILIFALWRFELRNKRSLVRNIIVISILLLNICILILSDSFLYKKINSNQYYWTEHKLKINHFKGKPDNTDEHTAYVFPSMVGKINRVFNYPSYIILTADKNTKSYIKNDIFSNSIEDVERLNGLLKHEKRHLDITEIYSRKASDSINNLILPSYQLKYDIVEYYYNVSDSVNDVFDKETEHGVNSETQMKWDNFIDTKLNLE